MFQYLTEGDKVALVAPAAFADAEAIKVLEKLLSQSGLIPIDQNSMNDLQSSPYPNQYQEMPYASSDDKRLQGFQASLNSDAKAIWVLHGGQGCEKIIAAVERGEITLPRDKKLIIGFSGVSNLHLYFLNKGWPCLHAPVGTIAKETHELTRMPINRQASLGRVIDTIMGRGESLIYALHPINDVAKNATNIINGTSVVGGCLNILVTHAGTKTALVGKDKIVFIEDEPKRPERIETMFMGLIRSGSFDGAKAVILGSFSDPELNRERFNIVKPILLERIAKMFADNGINVPVFHADNFGHGEFNDPLPLGTNASIQPGENPILTVEAM